MSHLSSRLLRAAFVAGTFVAGVTLVSPPATSADARTFAEFPDPHLKHGRAIWLETCEACHANDVAGAPLVTDKQAWASRLAKGRDALYRSALGGLTGPKGTQMPPRGGNDKLTDEEVKSAVDYMVALARQG